MIYPKLSDGTIDWCAMCKHEDRDLYDRCCECEYPENFDDPPTKYEPKPITNGDRIRSMSDEELAEWIVHKTDGNGFEGYNERVKAWLDWLKQEARGCG